MFKQLVIALVFSLSLMACNANSAPPAAVTPAALSDQPVSAAAVTTPIMTNSVTLVPVKAVAVEVLANAADASQPTDVNVMVQGEFPDACGQIGDIKQSIEGQAFIVTINATSDPNKMCAQVITPFSTTVTLDNTENLTNGDYRVTVNGISQDFNLRTPPAIEESMVGVPEIISAPLETIEVVITNTVSVIAHGTFANGCIHLGEISQQAIEQPQGLMVTINANRQTGVLCTQAMVPFSVTVPLEVAGWAAGTYQLQVNDLTTSFDLPANLAETDMPSFSPVTSTEIVSDEQRVDLPQMGLSVQIPANWVTVDEATWSPALTGTERLGITWTRTTSGWQPTNILPAQAQIVGRVTVELGWTTGILYQVTTPTTNTELHLIAPLDGPIAYDFWASAPTLQLLLEALAQSAQVSAPQLAACTPDTTTESLVSADGGFCLLYPNDFTVDEMAEVIVISGPNGGSLTITREPAERRDLDEIVQTQLRGLPANYGVKQSRLTMGNEPAVFLEGLPGRIPTRKLFVIHEETVYNLTFAPLNKPMNEEVNALWQTVARSFSFDVE